MFKKSAFTLIELLVVIAILAATLFPVFAQANLAAKKTADLSNTKNIATATMIYTNESDDLCPLQAGRDCGGLWNFNSRVYVPADWNKSRTDANLAGCHRRVRRVGNLASRPLVLCQIPLRTPERDFFCYRAIGSLSGWFATPGVASLPKIVLGAKSRGFRRMRRAMSSIMQ